MTEPEEILLGTIVGVNAVRYPQAPLGLGIRSWLVHLANGHEITAILDVPNPMYDGSYILPVHVGALVEVVLGSVFEPNRIVSVRNPT